MDFLDCLSSLLNCQYLSDLPRFPLPMDQAEKVLKIDDSCYTLEEINAAANYILHEDTVRFESKIEAKEAIVRQLTGNWKTKTCGPGQKISFY